jgi:hypothetical protein
MEKYKQNRQLPTIVRKINYNKKKQYIKYLIYL